MIFRTFFIFMTTFILSNCDMIAAPVSSHVATSDFGPISVNLPKQNTLGYDILVNVFFDFNIVMQESVFVGVGPTISPATDVIALYGNGIVNGIFSAIVPDGYYILVECPGSQGIMNTQVCPL